MKQYCIFDITKLILALFVVIIHSNCIFCFYPWVRVAVPLFFVISSFLLFSKINLSPKEEHDNIIKKYIIRNLKLYAYWFIILLPITIINRWHWFDYGFWIGILNIVKNTIFSATFAASWFITALVWAIFIVYKSSKLKNSTLLIISAIIYFLCCIKSSYSCYLSDCTILKQIYSYYTFFMPSPIFSFPVALFWVTLGKLFADNGTNMHNRNYYIAIAAISSIMLYCEWRFVYQISSAARNDCYLFLMPLVFALFGIIKDINIKIENSILLRKISVIFYCLHGSVVVATRFIIKHILHLSLLPTVENIIAFSTAITVCLISCYVIFMLENKKEFAILKYSH